MNKLLISAIAILGFASCKKESLTKQVTFTVGCETCYVKINKDKESTLVKNFYSRDVEMSKNDTAYVFAGVSAVTGSKSKITAKIRINGTTVAEKTSDANSTFIEVTAL